MNMKQCGAVKLNCQAMSSLKNLGVWQLQVVVQPGTCSHGRLARK